MEEKLSPAVTHVIAPKDTTARQAAMHFKAAGMETAMLVELYLWPLTARLAGLYVMLCQSCQGCLVQLFGVCHGRS